MSVVETQAVCVLHWFIWMLNCLVNGHELTRCITRDPVCISSCFFSNNKGFVPRKNDFLGVLYCAEHFLASAEKN